MNDKPMAGIVTFMIAAPLMLLCCLAPFVFVASTAGLLGWLAGGSIILGGMVATAVGASMFLIYRHRRLHGVHAKKTHHSEPQERPAE